MASGLKVFDFWWKCCCWITDDSKRRGRHLNRGRIKRARHFAKLVSWVSSFELQWFSRKISCSVWEQTWKTWHPACWGFMCCIAENSKGGGARSWPFSFTSFEKIGKEVGRSCWNSFPYNSCRTGTSTRGSVDWDSNCWWAIVPGPFAVWLDETDFETCSCSVNNPGLILLCDDCCLPSFTFIFTISGFPDCQGEQETYAPLLRLMTTAWHLPSFSFSGTDTESWGRTIKSLNLRGQMECAFQGPFPSCCMETRDDQKKDYQYFAWAVTVFWAVVFKPGEKGVLIQCRDSSKWTTLGQRTAPDFSWQRCLSPTMTVLTKPSTRWLTSFRVTLARWAKLALLALMVCNITWLLFPVRETGHFCIKLLDWPGVSTINRNRLKPRSLALAYAIFAKLENLGYHSRTFLGLVSGNTLWALSNHGKRFQLSWSILPTIHHFQSCFSILIHGTRGIWEKEGIWSAMQSNFFWKSHLDETQIFELSSSSTTTKVFVAMSAYSAIALSSLKTCLGYQQMIFLLVAGQRGTLQHHWSDGWLHTCRNPGMLFFQGACWS